MALKWCREHDIPTFGICLGMQCMVIEYARNVLGLEDAERMRDIPGMDVECEDEDIRALKRREISLADGSVHYDMDLDDSCYYRVLSEYAGVTIGDELELVRTLRDLSAKKGEYDRVESAMEEVRGKGYGIVIPGRSEISLEEPEVVKQGSKFGVRMRASAPSIHMIKADIRTEISPLVGSEQQAQDLIQYIKDAGNQNEEGIWETNIFGKSIGQIVNDGIQAKTGSMSDDCQQKLQRALQKIVNSGSSGMICIIL